MTFEEAFKELITVDWSRQSPAYKAKYGPYRSKSMAGKSVGDKIKREMLIQAGYTEQWIRF
jgi:hypothetical protein